MLTDRARQEAYAKAITNNAVLFKDKVVLDVGAGTGILSVFCVKAGAKCVYAVEPSNLAVIAKSVMTDNEISENQVKVLKIGKTYMYIWLLKLVHLPGSQMQDRTFPTRRKSGYYRIRMDGLLFAARRNAGFGSFREGSFSERRRSYVS